MATLQDEKFVHSVYFWLRPDLSVEQKNSFIQGLTALTTIETVKHGFIGVPGPTDRPIIDQSYSYALILAFDSKKDHDTYQDHPVHEDFRQTCGDFWSDIKIYDMV